MAHRDEVNLIVDMLKKDVKKVLDERGKDSAKVYLDTLTFTIKHRVISALNLEDKGRL